MSRGMRSTFFAIITAAAVMACAEENAAPKLGDKLTGFSVGEIGDTAISGGSQGPVSGSGPLQVGGTVRGIGTGADTLATAPILANFTVKAYKYVGYSGNDVVVGDQIGSFTTDANGWWGYVGLEPGKYVVTFTPPANSEFRGVYVTYDSPGAPPGTAVAQTWSMWLPRK